MIIFIPVYLQSFTINAILCCKNKFLQEKIVMFAVKREMKSKSDGVSRDLQL